MPATFDTNVTVNILRTAGAVARAEFGLICYGSTDTTFAVGVHKVYETIQAMRDDVELSAQALAAGEDFFRQDNHPPRFMVCEVTDEAGGGELAASLDAAYSAQPFYCLCLQSRVLLQIQTADLWLPTNYCMQFAQSSDAPFLAGTGDATNIAWVLDQAGLNRTMLVYHATDADELAVALAAEYFFADPDTQVTTLAYQQVTGIDPDEITDTEKANIFLYNANCYLTMGSQPCLDGGTVSGGDFVDQTLSGDWYAARVRERVQQLLLDKAALKTKVPYTQSGLEQIGAEIVAVQQQGENIGEGEDAGHFQVGRSFVTVPDISTIPAATRATRAATIAGTVYLTGAIQETTINLTVLAA